jgi:guanosine-3',5'-bis(diphosphate) 3'-pyrophosphohydrolase
MRRFWRWSLTAGILFGVDVKAEVVFRALSFAAHAHSQQRRHGSGEPYVNHLIDVAELLVRVAGVEDEDLLAAAVLHDVVEDTSVCSADVELEFGPRIRALVDALTDDKALAKEDRKRLQIEHMRSATAEVRLIKLADHCSNIATLPECWGEERNAAYIRWSLQVACECAGVHEALDREYGARAARARARLGGSFDDPPP